MKPLLFRQRLYADIIKYNALDTRMTGLTTTQKKKKVTRLVRSVENIEASGQNDN